MSGQSSKTMKIPSEIKVVNLAKFKEMIAEHAFFRTLLNLAIYSKKYHFL